MPTGNFQKIVNQANGNQIVSCFETTPIYNAKTLMFSSAFDICIDKFTLESLDLAQAISSLAQAPVPNINELEDNKAEQAAKIHAIWSNYPKIGVQLYFDSGDGTWIKQGEIIVVQNKPFQLPFSIMSPYLTSDSLKLLDIGNRLGIQIVSGGGYSNLFGTDYILIRGDWALDFTIVEK